MYKFEIKQSKFLEEQLITLAEAKAFLRVTTKQDDELITSQLLASMNFAENYLRLDLHRREIVANVIGNSIREFKIKSSPLYKLIHIRDLSLPNLILKQGDDYELEDSKVIFKTHPSIKGLEVRYISGYKALPHSIKQGILIYLGLLYDREIINNESLETVFFLLNPYRVIRI